MLVGEGFGAVLCNLHWTGHTWMNVGKDGRA